MEAIFFLLFTGFAIGISGAMIPGPLTFFTISEVLRSNRFAGLKIIAGHITIEAVFILLILSGMHKFLGSERFITVVSMTGGIALVAMGTLLLIKAPKMSLPRSKPDMKFKKGLFVGGILFSVTSPGFLIWWATIGVSTLIKSLVFGILGVIVLTVGHWIADTAWYWSLSYAVDKGKQNLSDRSYRNVLKSFAVVLVVLGIYFLVNGSSSQASAEEETPPGMRIEKVGDLQIMVPKDAEVTREGSGAVSIEDNNLYMARKFEEMEERLKELEAAQDKLEKQVDEILSEFKKDSEKNLISP